jgi:hypothetical protein
VSRPGWLRLQSSNGPDGPLPGRYSPLPGRHGPLPGRYSPLPGRHGPLPGRYGPLPGRYGPLPGSRQGGPARLTRTPRQVVPARGPAAHGPVGPHVPAGAQTQQSERAGPRRRGVRPRRPAAAAAAAAGGRERAGPRRRGPLSRRPGRPETERAERSSVAYRLQCRLQAPVSSLLLLAPPPLI